MSEFSSEAGNERLVGDTRSFNTVKAVAAMSVLVAVVGVKDDVALARLA